MSDSICDRDFHDEGLKQKTGRLSIAHCRTITRIFCACCLVATFVTSTPATAQDVKATLPFPALPRDEKAREPPTDDATLRGTLTYISDINAVVDGGMNRGANYLQRIGLIGDADLDRALGWHGASAHISVHLISGTGLSARRVGNLLTVSGIEAEPAARLFNLWLEQKVGNKVSVRIGQFTAAQEFAVSPTAALFVNSTFGWPASFATDLPSGGPAYPLAAPGVRLSFNNGKGFDLRMAVFAGDPAGPGTGDPQRRDLHGFNGFGLKGRPFIIGELSRSGAGLDPASTVTIGGWVHGDNFDDLAIDDNYASLAAPTSTGIALTHRGNWSVYALVDTRVWRQGSRSIRAFLRATASPADRNPIDLYLDAGLSISAPLRARAGDIVGLGIALGRISPRLRSRILEQAARSGIRSSVPGFEALVEASWQVQLHPNFSVQPSVQFVFHPAAAILSTDSSAAFPTMAVVLGVRTSVRF